MQKDRVTSDPRFLQGRAFLDEQNFEQAIALFASLTETCVQSYGEMSPESARAYYEYGNALLTQEEENPRGGLLGNADEPAGEAGNDDGEVDGDDKPVSGDNADDREDDDEDEDEDEGAADGAVEETADDLQVAWEVLDVARCILEKDEGCDQMLLSDVYVRLADLLRLNDSTAEAVVEYSKALKIRQALCLPHDRKLSEVHFSLAVAHVYHASKGNAVAEKRSALDHYRQAREVLARYQEQKQDATVAEILDELAETIDSLQAEILEDEKNTPYSSSGSSSSGVGGSAATTIGFGLPSAAAGAALLNATLVGAKRSSGESAAIVSSSLDAMVPTPALAPAPVNTLQVKKKAKLEPPHPVSE